MKSWPLVLLGVDGSSQGRSRPYFFCYQDYVNALESVRLSVALVPWQSREALDRLLSVASGLVIPGGDDLILPDPLPEEVPVEVKRQDTDEYLVKRALEIQIPVLGICYGMQLLQHLYGGEIIRHLPNASRHTQGHIHDLVAQDEGCQFFGQEPWSQPSYHHQGVKMAATSLEPLVFSDDGLIEGFWDPKFSFVAGFQWHVENLKTSADMTVFSEFSKVVYNHYLSKIKASG